MIKIKLWLLLITSGGILFLAACAPAPIPMTATPEPSSQSPLLQFTATPT